MVSSRLALALVLLPLGALQAQARPDIVFVLTDDMSRADLDSMPLVRARVADSGASFSNFFVNVSLCCPSRATILTGRYAHNTGVRSNGGLNGGYPAALRGGLEGHTVAAWLRAAGYRTALIGKYLNGYPIIGQETHVPPDWTTWVSPAGGHPYAEYEYTLNQNGRLVYYGRTPADYGTDVYLGHALDFIRSSATDHVPFFLYLALYPPHEPATAAPRHARRFRAARAPRTPAYDEEDVSDKPLYLARAPRLAPRTQARVDDLYRRRLRSLLSVDEAVARIVDTLAALDLLRDTYIVFASDNGFHLGQHRLPAGKRSPYEEDIHVPLLVRGPGIAPRSVISALTLNTDLAPTFADLAGVRPADTVDGRSLAPLLQSQPPARWRSAVLLDMWRLRPNPELRNRPVDELALPDLEPPDLDELAERGLPEPDEREAGLAALGRIPSIPPYHGVRTARYAYVEYATGERELYDLAADPDELDNLAGRADPALLDSLAARLARLRSCRGAGCRQAEE
jgi:arylsulfatase A-like enzyme